MRLGSNQPFSRREGSLLRGRGALGRPEVVSAERTSGVSVRLSGQSWWPSAYPGRAAGREARKKKDPTWVRTRNLLRGTIPASSEGERETPGGGVRLEIHGEGIVGRVGGLGSGLASTDKGHVPGSAEGAVRKSSDGGGPTF